MTAPVHIVGIGSPNGLDQAGWRLCDELEKALPAEYISHGLVAAYKCAAPGLVPAMVSDAELVLLIDALSGSCAAGEVCRVDPDEFTPIAGASSSHGVSLQEVVLLLESLSLLPPRMVIFGIGTGAPDTGNPASAMNTIAAAALPVLARAVAAEISNYLVTHAPASHIGKVHIS